MRARQDNRIMAQRESAICLRTVDYSETSQVVHFLTRGAGVVRLLAKGTKRPKSSAGGAVDLLAEGELVFIAKRDALGTLVEFAETTCHLSLRRQADRLNTALYMLELVGAMCAEADPHPEVFDLLHNALTRMEQPASPVAAVLAYFQWRLLKHAGLLGQLTQCAECGRRVNGNIRTPRDEVYFSSRVGGILCRACEGSAIEKYRINGDTLAGLAAMRAAQAGTKVTLSEAQAQAVSRTLAYHINQQLGKPLKMARYVLDANGSRPGQ